MEQQIVAFIGAGNMSRAIISGLVKQGYDATKIIASNPSMGKLTALQQDFGIEVTQNNIDAIERAQVVILSVKPQLMAQVCAEFAHLDFANKLVMTVAAGIPASRYQDYLKQPLRFIRVMPNTPMQLGCGMSGLYATDAATEEDKARAAQLMQSGGQTIWVEQESGLDLVIALAGSSPAYFFLFVESMIEAAQSMGMNEDDARQLAQQAAFGASQMLIQNPELSAKTLRENVTSKGGTTHEAVQTFEQGDLRGLVKQAMQNCIARAEEMSKIF